MSKGLGGNIIGCMQGHQNHNPFYLRVMDYSVVIIWSYMVLEKLK